LKAWKTTSIASRPASPASSWALARYGTRNEQDEAGAAGLEGGEHAGGGAAQHVGIVEARGEQGEEGVEGQRQDDQRHAGDGGGAHRATWTRPAVSASPVSRVTRIAPLEPNTW
jgi:hypothetical protein